MSLFNYNKKRDFTHTPEPKPKKESSNEKPIFVVQEHQASQLHFDFRLEVDGVLKSWAVPKGPSMYPADKRLAVMVEDHPLEYAKFEGTIPEGNYGAGTVKIWDSGYWEPYEGFEDVIHALINGTFEFILHGKKLNGAFALIKMKKANTKNAWLLIKKHDEYSEE